MTKSKFLKISSKIKSCFRNGLYDFFRLIKLIRKMFSSHWIGFYKKIFLSQIWGFLSRGFAIFLNLGINIPGDWGFFENLGIGDFLNLGIFRRWGFFGDGDFLSPGFMGTGIFYPRDFLGTGIFWGRGFLSPTKKPPLKLP